MLVICLSIEYYRLEYNPLVLCKDKPENFQDDKYTLKAHVGNITDLKNSKKSDHDQQRNGRNIEENDKDLDRNSLITQSKHRK